MVKDKGLQMINLMVGNICTEKKSENDSLMPSLTCVNSAITADPRRRYLYD